MTTSLYYITQEPEYHGVPKTQRPRAAPVIQTQMPSTSQDMKLAVRLALETARIDKELTVSELAEITGIRASALRDYETGRAFPRAEDISTLETHLETTIVPQ